MNSLIPLQALIESIEAPSLEDQALLFRPLAKADFRPPSPPNLGENTFQSPPELGDLGGIPGFMQEVF